MTSAPAAASRSVLPSLKALRNGSAPPRRRSRRVWWFLLILLLIGVAVVAMRSRPPEVQASGVMSAYPSAQYAQLTASGYVVAQRRAAVASKATGRLVELRVREGSLVQAGELIARLDAADVQAALVSAQAAVRQAEAGQRQAEAVLAQARVELANAEAELKRAQGLEQQGFVSAQAIDGNRRRVASARASVEAARAGVAAAQGAVAQARAQVTVQQVGRDSTEIRAPFDGVVLVKNANVGDMITPFSSAAGAQGAVVTMADLGTLEVEADVAESNIGLIRPDQPVEIALDALPALRFRGSVARIVPTVDRAKATVMTKVRFEQLDPRILPEMSARVVFLSQPVGVADQQPVTAVNPKTVVDRGGVQTVFRIVGEQVEALPVTPGRTLGDALELRDSPLKPGDRLVLAPPVQLQGGERVVVAGK